MASGSATPNYGLEVRHVLRGFTRALANSAAAHALTAAEFRLLRTLDEVKGATQVELAALAAMDRPYVSSLVKRLGGRGLLQSAVASSDRRRVDISITAQGRRVFDAVARDIDQVNRAAMRGIPAAERRAFLAALRTVRANLDALAPPGSGETG